jgi:hypothetical protein
MVIPALRLAPDPAWGAALPDTTPVSRHHCNGLGFAPHNGASAAADSLPVAAKIVRYSKEL